MKRLVPLVIRPWMLPLIVAALAVPIVAGFYLAGPPLGLAAGAIAVASLLGIAANATYDEPIEPVASPDARYRLLVVTTEPVDEPAAVERIAAMASEGQAAFDPDDPPELLVLVPVPLSTLDRWASDLAGARDEADRVLALSLAALAKAGLDATGATGDADPVQAIDDQLQSFAAREVAVVASERLGPAEAEELGRRLDRPVRVLDAAAG